MSDGITNHFEPNKLGVQGIGCMRCGHYMIADDEGLGGTIARSESSFDKVLSSTPYWTGTHINPKKGDHLVASHHATHGLRDARGNDIGDFFFYVCPICGNDDLPVDAVLDVDRLRLKNEDTRYKWEMPENPVVWMPCEPWITKKGKRMTVKAVPLTPEEIITWKKIRAFIDSTYSLDELAAFFKKNRRRGRAKQLMIENLSSITTHVSYGVKEMIKHHKGMILIRHSSAHHGQINIKTTPDENGIWNKVSAWRPSYSIVNGKKVKKWVDVCDTNGLLDPKWTGEYSIDRGAPVTTTEWIKDDKGYGWRTMSKIYDDKAKAMVVLEEETRHVLFIEDMGDPDEEDTMTEPDDTTVMPEVEEEDEELERICPEDELKVKDWQGKSLRVATTLRNPPHPEYRKVMAQRALTRAIAEDNKQAA